MFTANIQAKYATFDENKPRSCILSTPIRQWKTLFGRESRCQRMSYVEGKHVCNAQPLCNQDNRNSDDEKEEKDGIQYTWWW